MEDDQAVVSFREREFRGSRFRCLLATQQSKSRVIRFLNTLIEPFAVVGEHDRWMPDGFSSPDEVRLDEKKSGFFPDDNERKALTEWWLAVRQGANTPNWDLVSTCTVGEKPGLLLAEAKAHEGELNLQDKCGSENPRNRQRIDLAINDASQGLGKGWGLRADSHYQLSNRFAWAWKIARSGKPVVLVYLGFLNASEMAKPFTNHNAWESFLLDYSKEVVPANAWKSGGIKVGDDKVIPLIRSADVNVAIR